MKKTYAKGKLPKLWPLLVKIHQENPEHFASADQLENFVSGIWHALRDKEHCPNCGEGMTEYVHKLDFFNALLLKKMGEIVHHRVGYGMAFTEANQVHVVGEDFHDCVRHRTTQCRTLGLIAKVKTADGKHDREKGWLITARGFAALRGEPVPAEVAVFRNHIEERFDRKVTLAQVFASYAGENKHLTGEYDPMKWVHFGKAHEGALL